jgi:1,4-alpha-glucan branching enzyme
MIPGRYALVLHGHIPDVLGHGIWPHGEDWLYEAAAESYLAMIQGLDRLFERGVPVRMTLGLTPVLACQLADPRFHAGFVDYLAHRIQAGIDDEKAFAAKGDEPLARLAAAWRIRYETKLDAYRDRCRGSLVGAFREIAERGQIELMTSSATHGYSPLLPSEASLRAQVQVGVATARRLFGRAPRAYWIPECAYRPEGLWHPPWHGRSFTRAGVESHLAANGVAVTIVDSHLIGAERAPSMYGGGGTGRWRDDRSPLRVYRIGAEPVRILTREPEISLYVWSGQFGYPGDPNYLEFHRKHEPGGLRYWRVTDARVGLDRKAPYDPATVPERVREHAAHFVSMVRRRLLEEAGALGDRAILTTPFDLELFGHWWYEGMSWLEQVFENLAEEGIRTVFASEAADDWPDADAIRLPEGSWGEGGDHRVWWNEGTRGYWEWVVRTEKDVRELARDAGDRLPGYLVRTIVRQLLILQASDWPFSIRQGTSADYAEGRIQEHSGDLAKLTAIGRAILAGEAPTRREHHFMRLVADRDPVFHDDDLPPLSHWAEPRRGAIEVLGGPPRVALIAAECSPLAKVGGLADVVGSLPQALERTGCEVRVLLPLYRDIDRGRFGIDQVEPELLRLSDTGEDFQVRRIAVPGLGKVDLVDIPWAFDRPGIYDAPGPLPDELARFLAFCRGSLDSLYASGFRPDVLHLHDHQTSVTTELLRSTGRGEALGHPAVVFTIHNMGHLGEYDFADWHGNRLPWEAILSQAPFEFHGKVSLLKGGITLADRVTTVSERYAVEISTNPALAHGLEGVLRARREALVGILNGIDLETWDPQSDPAIARRYGPDTIEEKRLCRNDLLARLSLADPGPDGPVFGLVSRLGPQKGIDRLLAALPRMLDSPGAFVFLGAGEEFLEEGLRKIAEEHPTRVAFAGGAQEDLAHAIIAGADFFLMPSRWEPCGLTQMYSLRYGTVPVVRETGGLADTVVDVDRDRENGTGISYRLDSPGGLLRAVGRARRLFADRSRLGAVRRRGMVVDFSWDRAARRYVEVYREAVEAARWD